MIRKRETLIFYNRIERRFRMTILCIILGILLIGGGVSLMLTPLATFMAAGFIIGIGLLVYGIVGLANSIKYKVGALAIITNVLAIIVGIICFIRPGATLVIDTVLLYIIGAYFVLHGILSIAISFQEKKESDHWFLGLITGILSIGVGVFTFIFPQVTAVAVGILIGLYFIEAGISLIAMRFALDDD